MDPIQLTLFVAGRTVRSERAIAHLRRIADEAFPGRCELEIVDVVERPDAADEARILTTPTLLKRSPPPQRRVIGDLSDTERVLSGLALEHGPTGAPGERGEPGEPGA